MDLTLTPSLEFMSAVKIATTLWTEDDVKSLMVNFISKLFKGEKENNWQEIEDKVLGKALQISKSVILRGIIAGCIKPVGLQIFNWIRDARRSFDEVYVTTNLSRLTWTRQGTVDKRKTAEVVIENRNVDITIRYKLACVYCFEDDIRTLWRKIPEEIRERYDANHPLFFDQPMFVRFWSCFMEEKLERFGIMHGGRWIFFSHFQCAFEFAAEKGNKAATVYFHQKLTPEEAKKSMTTAAEYIIARCLSYVKRSENLLNEDADILCFLLSRMDEEERKKLIDRKPHQILGYFLQWPWQSLFMEVAKHMWDSIHRNHYFILLEIIINKVIDGFGDFDYQDAFREIWRRIPKAHKSYVIEDCNSVFLFDKLFRIKDEKTIKLIFETATRNQKMKLIFCKKGLDICLNLIGGNDWNLLKFFITESLQSVDEIANFKQSFVEHVMDSFSKEELANNAEKWNKFFTLLDDLICKKGKGARSGDNRQLKRLHGIQYEEVTSIKQLKNC